MLQCESATWTFDRTVANPDESIRTNYPAGRSLSGALNTQAHEFLADPGWHIRQETVRQTHPHHI